ncbi:MAG: glycoside hydrolase family 97 N-terminal domain-containing protein, partial [Marinilabiliales bacterium]|nr:glycoside hydrolase family 97 N-terminal domain-containing protein [Marinilabiliales bacterium]
MRSIVGLLFMLMTLTALAKDYTVNSPDGKITVKVTLDHQIHWSAMVGNDLIFSDNRLSLDLGD